MSDDAFGSAGGSVPRRRFNEQYKVGAFSPSYGVRHGFKADSERALPQSLENLRHHHRVAMSFEALIDGKWRWVAGDVSAGGALVLLPFRLSASELEVRIAWRDQSWTGSARVLGISGRGERLAHHLQFTDLEKASALSVLA